ncbi:MAG: hypothetical protein II705_04735 [Clostridia bacterium]|nr:hypothetical protein [Clostridia bacterium]
MAQKKKEKDDFLYYKGKPFVRCENTIYYGNMTDPYVIVMQILDSKKVGDLNVASKVSVQLVLTDENVKPKDKIVKRIEKPGIYSAMDIADVWLERANAKK